MIKKDLNPNYKEIYNFVKEKFEKTSHFKHGPFDETYYSLRVYESAKEIISKLNKKVKKNVVLVACILHDVGKIKLKTSKIFGKNRAVGAFREEWRKHPKLSVPIARRFLKKRGYSKEFIDEDCYLVENHDMRGDLLDKRCVELKIIQDADLIADIGFAGFIRPFLYCGKFSKQSIISSIKFIQTEDRTMEGGLINLSVSKNIAKREMKIQNDLVNEISKDIKSDLL